MTFTPGASGNPGGRPKHGQYRARAAVCEAPGFEADCEKVSTAAALGFRVIRLTRAMIEDGRAVTLIGQALVAGQPATEGA